MGSVNLLITSRAVADEARHQFDFNLRFQSATDLPIDRRVQKIAFGGLHDMPTQIGWRSEKLKLGALIRFRYSYVVDSFELPHGNRNTSAKDIARVHVLE